MNVITCKKMLSLSFAVTIILGIAIHRAFSDWQALVNDVGDDGAWIVSIVYYSIYGVLISIGTLLSAITLSRINKRLHRISVCAAALISIVILEIFLKARLAHNTHIFWEIVALLISSSWLFNSVFTPDVWLHNKRVHGSNKPPRDP